MKIINYIKFLRKVDVVQFFYLNYFCPSIKREDGSKIIPYKNTVVDIEENAKIILSKGDLEFGCDKLRKSKSETRIRLRENAVWNSNGGAEISYGITIEILNCAMNSNCQW